MQITKLSVIFFTCFISVFFICKAQYSFDTLALANRLQEISSDKFEGRATDTKGGKLARKYIAELYKSAGVKQFNRSYFQTFKFLHEETDKITDGANVMGYITGVKYPDKFIVISAHYDHLGIHAGEIHNGADDDGSGICALLSFAEHFQSHFPDYSVIFLACDAEEIGLKGSYHFVDHPPVPINQIVFNINLDMIGRNIKNEIYLCGTSHYKELKKVLKDIDLESDLKVKFGHDKKRRGKKDWTDSSDHAPFHEAKIPFIYIGEEDHEDYHRATDDFEKIDMRFYIKAVDLCIKVYERIEQSNLY